MKGKIARLPSRKHSESMGDQVLNLVNTDLCGPVELVPVQDKEAMEEQIVLLSNNDSWNHILPKGRKSVGCKRAYKLKHRQMDSRNVYCPAEDLLATVSAKSLNSKNGNIQRRLGLSSEHAPTHYIEGKC